MHDTGKETHGEVRTTVPPLVRNRVCVVTYACRDIGYGVEEGTIRAYWTGHMDTTGKYTIVHVEGYRAGEPLYLFLDEIKEVTEP